MIEADFYVEPATWVVDRVAIEAIRSEVFIVEQRVPPEEEFDQDDPLARHYLARSNQGKVIGTARLLVDGRIGRMAVHKDWRGRGVGAALLRSAIEDARLQRLPEVRLAAQTHAIGFYQRHGFAAYGNEFDDANIPHRWMRLPLESAGIGPVTRSRRQPTALACDAVTRFERREELRGLLLAMVQACHNELAIWTRDLEGPILDDDAMLEAFKQLAVTAPRPEIRILLLDSARAVNNDHRLLKLAQRLPSAIHIRRPAKQHRDYLPAFVVVDDKHSLFREFGDRPQGVLQANDRLNARRLLESFNPAWGQSETDPDLQRLDL